MHFDRVEYRISNREFHTHTGYLGSHRISALSTGIGPDNIDIVLNELDALLNIDLKNRQVKAKRKSTNYSFRYFRSITKRYTHR